MQHWHIAEPGDRSFCVFNDDGSLTMEPVTIKDLVPVQAAPGSFYASAAWSADCNWYFVILPGGIALLSVATDRGFLCRKKSDCFIELFLNAPQQS